MPIIIFLTLSFHNGVACLLNRFTNINLQDIANTEQGVECWIPRIRFQTAYQRLAKAGFFRQRISRVFEPLSFLD